MPFGVRASNSSSTRGRPLVMSMYCGRPPRGDLLPSSAVSGAPRTPPVWNVRIVSCVPGSPIDCAATIPTASPISTTRARAQVPAVALPADAVARLAEQRRAHVDPRHLRRCAMRSRSSSVDDRAVLVQRRPRPCPCSDRPPRPPGTGRRAGRGAFCRRCGSVRSSIQMPFLGAAVLVVDDDVLRDVDQTPRQVARVRRSDGGVGQTLSGAVGREEVLQHREPLAEARTDRQLDDAARRVGHQAAHPGHLRDLLDVSLGARLGHHRDRPERVERACRRPRSPRPWSASRPR